ncbi:hypothetical protein LV164_001525 [Aspergillus fumigatus]|nr:hypothetical protein KXX58_003262 [Aspergillus fumigatus]KAH1486642.1 hypothetical protein KXX42_004722 [Aspergillus fumigatus]KAH1544906.1 hypothetical protein KXX57_005158 [Aspergillus fumigatus]KAH1972442.1 hypothetical protein KXW88_002097 [Aspergillus fumigatus]KAH2301918.1 hypothetical protein KXV47_001681 [Aspergillus fumigatus]
MASFPRLVQSPTAIFAESATSAGGGQQQDGEQWEPFLAPRLPSVRIPERRRSGFPDKVGKPFDAVFGRPSATPSATSSCTYVHAPPSTDRRPTQTSFVRSAVYLLANTDFPYTSLRSLKCAKNGALSTVPL